MIPDRDACLRLLEEAGVNDDVLEHILAVEQLAARMAEHVDGADGAVVQAGALLHDVGRAFDHGLDHLPKGVAFLEDRGIDQRVVACVATHVGAGVEPEQAERWGWPSDRSYMPETVEQRIVCHADNLTFGTRYGKLADVVEKLERQNLGHVARRARSMHDELAREMGKDPDVLVDALDREAR